MFQWKLQFCGVSKVSIFSCDGPIKMAHCKQKKKRIMEGTPLAMSPLKSILRQKKKL
jgi:hypothetical protein